MHHPLISEDFTLYLGDTIDGLLEEEPDKSTAELFTQIILPDYQQSLWDSMSRENYVGTGHASLVLAIDCHLMPEDISIESASLYELVEHLNEMATRYLNLCKAPSKE